MTLKYSPYENVAKSAKQKPAPRLDGQHIKTHAFTCTKFENDPRSVDG
jgi:hypothetical protein